MRINFYKRQFDEMVVEVEAEDYSPIQASHFKNYFGTDSGLTFRHLQSNEMVAIGLYSIGYNKFEGVVPLEFIPMGLYQLQGRIEDGLGNAAIISDYFEPTNLPLQLVEVFIEFGYNLVPILNFTGAYDDDIEKTGNYHNFIEVTVSPYPEQIEYSRVGTYDKEIELPCL